MNKFLSILKEPRFLLLNLLKRKPFSYLNDNIYIKIKYFIEMNKKLELTEPKTFNEKLQWLKLNDRKHKYTKMVDKHGVRQYIAEKIGEEFLVPIYGVYNQVEDIDFNKLPQQFVIKPTHTSGDVFICRDKNSLNVEKLKKMMNNWLKRDYYLLHREWPYKNIEPKLIIEKFMFDQNSNDLIDYKFMTFNGKVRCILVVADRNTSKPTTFSFLDRNWEELPFNRPGKNSFSGELKKPVNFEKMMYFSEILGKNIPFVRVDFYEVNGKLYFGELTLYPGAGFEKFEPEEFDKKLGELLYLKLDNDK